MQLLFPEEIRDRLSFVCSLVPEAIDPEDAILRAIRLYDRLACAMVIEGSSATLRHRDGTVEAVTL